jgi:isopenicillin N synthase-like dioxygenase
MQRILTTNALDVDSLMGAFRDDGFAIIECADPEKMYALYQASNTFFDYAGKPRFPQLIPGRWRKAYTQHGEREEMWHQLYSVNWRGHCIPSKNRQNVPWPPHTKKFRQVLDTVVARTHDVSTLLLATLENELGLELEQPLWSYAQMLRYIGVAQGIHQDGGYITLVHQERPGLHALPKDASLNDLEAYVPVITTATQFVAFPGTRLTPLLEGVQSPWHYGHCEADATRQAFIYRDFPKQ